MAEIEPKSEVANERKTEAPTAPKPKEKSDQKSEQKSEAALAIESKAESEPKQGEKPHQAPEPPWYDRAINFLEIKGRPIGWIATIAVPIVLAFYAFKADKLAEQQHKQTVEQTEIQEAQRDIAKRQTNIQEAQNELTKLQYEPAFTLRVNSDADSKSRVVDVYNLGATVRDFDAFLYSSIRVDWLLPTQNRRRHVTFFGFTKGSRSADKLPPQAVAQFKTGIPSALLQGLQASVRNTEARQAGNQWIVEAIEQNDWVHITFKTRASDQPRVDDQQMGDRFITRNPVVSMGEAARESFYYDGVITMQDQMHRFTDYLGGFFKIGDDKRNHEFILAYMKHAHLACPAIRNTVPLAQAQIDVLNAIEQGTALEEAFFAKIQSPTRCKQVDTEVTVDGTKYNLNFVQ